MVKKQPDSFERMVQAYRKEASVFRPTAEVVSALNAENLLRQYHHEVLALVKGNLATVSQCPTKAYCDGYNEATAVGRSLDGNRASCRGTGQGRSRCGNGRGHNFCLAILGKPMDLYEKHS